MNRVFFFASLVFFHQTSQAQLINGNAFLKGNYVEVGLAPYGIYGTTIDAPADYHARSAMISDDPNFKKLGFVADPGKDGWDIGTPNHYRGDYFLPAAPYVGWGVNINGQYYVSERSENGAVPTIGNLPGWQNIPAGSVQGVTTSAATSQADWETVVAGLRVHKTVSVPINGTYFTIRIVVTNTTASPLTNVFYDEYINPDNDAVYNDIASLNPFPNVTTRNAIAYQNPTDKKALVTALGWKYQTYLGLASKDCRARVCRGTNFEDEPYQVDAQGFYFGAGQASQSGDDLTFDQNHYIAIAFQLGTLSPGDSTGFTYAYVLSESDLDEALGRTDVQFETNGALYLSGDNIKTCPGDKISLSVTNAGDLAYTWSSTDAGVNGTTGLNANIIAASTPTSYSVTGTGACGPKTVQVTVVPDQPPAPAVPAEVNYCINASAQPLSATGINLQWYTDPAASGGSPTAPIPSTTTAGATTWYVRQTSATGCTGPFASTQVIVHPADQITQTISICADKLPYTWNGINVPLPGYAVATYRMANHAGCDSTITLNLLTTPLPGISLTKSNDISCLTPTATLTATGGRTYHWEPAGGLSNPDTATTIARPGQTTTYQVTATNDGGCMATSSITIRARRLQPARPDGLPYN